MSKRYASKEKIKEIEASKENSSPVSTRPEDKELKRLWSDLENVVPAEEGREVKLDLYLNKICPLTLKDKVIIKKYFPETWTMWLKYKRILLEKTDKADLKFGVKKIKGAYETLKLRIQEFEAEKAELELEEL